MEKIEEIFSKSKNIWILFIAWILFASNLWLPRNWGFYGTADWDLTYSTFEVARINIIEYGEWPSYQEFLAFGSDLDANPQAVGGSVFIIPVLIFGTFYGYKLSILFAMLIGLWGSFKLFKLYCLDNFISISMSLIFVGAPYFSRHIFEAGHSNFLFFYFLPWIFYHLENYKISGRHKYLIFLTLLLAIPVSGGAPLVTIIASTGVFLLGLGYFLIEKRPIQFIGGLITSIIFSLILNSWKILPALELWEQSPRLTKDESGINILVYFQSLCDFPIDTNTPHQWHEFAIGFPIILIVFSAYKIFEIKNIKYWIILCLPVIWIGLGNSPSYFNPWYLLNHYVPVFSSLRAPYRIGVLSLLILCVFFLKTYKLYNYKELIYLILVSSILTQTLSFNSISNKMVFTKRIEEIQLRNTIKKHDVIRLKKHEIESQFYFIKKQCFVQNAYEPLNLLEVSDSLNTFITGGCLLDFRPNQILINSKDSLVKTSIRFNKNWKLIGTGKIINQNGLLCVKSSTGKIELFYKNERTRIGLAFSIISLILFSFFLRFTSFFEFKPR
jgi:hypothetical protein